MMILNTHLPLPQIKSDSEQNITDENEENEDLTIISE